MTQNFTCGWYKTPTIRAFGNSVEVDVGVDVIELISTHLLRA
jgi:hypothetical protein